MKQRIEDHIKTAQWLTSQVKLLEAIVDEIVDCFARGGKVYTLGNGGSAADAQHIAAELVGRFKIDRRPLPAAALTTDTSTLTAIGNDLGSNEVFARQVEAHVGSNDLVWALSVSGRSPNILAAVRMAARRGARVIGFTSRKGAALAEYCTHCLRVDHDDSDRVQEMHLLAYHLVCEEVEKRAAQAAMPADLANVTGGGQSA